MDSPFARNIAVHIFDTQNEYADVLAPLFSGDVLECLDASDCRFNPFDGPNTIPHPDWVLNMMCNYLREAFYWQDRTMELFRTVCLSHFESHDHLTSVMFADAYARIPENKKRWPEFGSLGRFVTMLRSMPTFQCLRGESIEESTRKSRVYNLRFLAEDARLFLISHIVTFLAMVREYRRNRPLDLLLVFDGLSQFFTKDTLRRYQGILESFYLRLLRSDRTWGIGAILADQNYTLIHDLAKSNCQIKMGMDMRDGASRRQFAMDLGLNQEQERFLAELSYQQDQRRVVVQLRHYPHPFLMKIPNFEKPEPLTPEALERRRKEAVSRIQWTPEEKSIEQTMHEAEEKRQMESREIEILKTVGCNAQKLFSHEEWAVHMRWTESTFSKYAKKLKQMGYLEQHTINLYGAGRQFDVLVPTEDGYAIPDKLRLSYSPIPGNGSIQHRYWQRRIWESQRQKGDLGGIEYELHGTGKRVDVGILSPVLDITMKTALEVVMGPNLEKELSNARKDLAAGWDRVIFCVEQDDVRQSLAKLLAKAFGDSEDRIEIRLLREFAPPPETRKPGGAKKTAERQKS